MITRYTFYKIKLHMSNGQFRDIMVATTDIQKIEPLIEKHKIMYARHQFIVAGFEIKDTHYTMNLPEDVYQREIEFCDIVDEEALAKHKPEVQSWSLGTMPGM